MALLPVYLCANVPKWYASTAYISHGTLFYGYGLNKEYEKAVAQAKQSVAAEVSTKIESSVVQRSEHSGTKGSNSVKAIMKASTNVNLVGVTVMKKAFIDSVWYVMVRYEKLSIEQKVIEGLIDSPCNETVHTYLHETPLIQRINAGLRCEHRFGIERKDKQWQLEAKGFETPLSNSEFDQLFKTVYSPTVSLNISPNKRLYEDDAFSLIVKSKKGGFLTLLTVYENGKVGVLLSSKPVQAHKAVQFPAKDDPNEMVAGLVVPNKATKDLYIAIISDKKIDTTRFETVGNTFIEGEDEYKFMEVIELLDQTTFTTLLVRTYPK